MAQNRPTTAITKPHRRGPGRRWPKGLSGNPGGRPKAIAEVRDLARALTADAIGALVDIAVHGQNELARIAAAKELLDRGWGRPLPAQPADDMPQGDWSITFRVGDPPDAIQSGDGDLLAGDEAVALPAPEGEAER